MTSVIPRLLHTITSPTPPKVVCIFVGESTCIEPAVLQQLITEITSSLPEHFSTTIDILSVANSTAYLRGSRNRVTVLYTQCCFKHITPEEFVNTHYDWLYKQVRKLYQRQPASIEAVFSPDDAFQETFFYLDRILSKYDNQCNLRTYVANRLRWYFDLVLKEKLTARRDELVSLLYREDIHPSNTGD